MKVHISLKGGSEFSPSIALLIMSLLFQLLNVIDGASSSLEHLSVTSGKGFFFNFWNIISELKQPYSYWIISDKQICLIMWFL